MYMYIDCFHKLLKVFSSWTFLVAEIAFFTKIEHVNSGLGQH